MTTTEPLWRDPVRWSESFAKTKVRVLIWTAVHAAFVFGGIFAMYAILGNSGHGPESSIALNLASIVFPLTGVLYPGLYLYAMFRILKSLKEQQSQNNTSEHIP